MKYYTSLQQKKYRNLSGRFLIEGEKMVTDFLEHGSEWYKAVRLLAVEEYLRRNESLCNKVSILEIDERDLKKISSLNTPNNVILELEDNKPGFQPDSIKDVLSVYLNDIRDPGNLGTIIRTADWFGIRNIFCSRNSVDLFNSKVLQSTMGSFARVRVLYVDPYELIETVEGFPDYNLYATLLEGDNIYEKEPGVKGMLFFGNESSGLPDELIKKCNYHITIPRPGISAFPESLNLGISVGICLSERQRRIIQSGN